MKTITGSEADLSFYLTHNFKFLDGYDVSVTPDAITTSLIGADLVNAINGNFDKFETLYPGTISDVTIGMKGSDFIKKINDNFTVKGNNIKNETQDSATFFNRPVIVFSFDDGYPQDYTAFYPVFQARGKSFTSYIYGSRSDINWAYFKTMYDAGIDIGCHAYNHVMEATLTEQQLRDSMVNNNTVFLANGIIPPDHHAYPYYSQNATVRNVLKDYRKTCRGSSNSDGWANLMIDSVANQTFVRKDSNIHRLQNDGTGCLVAHYDAIIDNIDRIIANKEAYMLNGHGNLDDVTTLTNVIDYCITNNVEILDMAHFYYKYGDMITGTGDGTPI